MEIKTNKDIKELNFDVDSVKLIDSIQKEDVYILTFEYPSLKDAREDIFNPFGDRCIITITVCCNVNFVFNKMKNTSKIWTS